MTLKLRYAILEGCSLTLMDEIPAVSELDARSRMDAQSSFDETPMGPPQEEYVVMRKQCLLDHDKARL